MKQRNTVIVSSMKTDLVFYETKIYVLENTSLSFHNHCYASSCLFALNENLMNLGQNLA